MKLEKLEKIKKSKIVIGVAVFLSFMSVIMYVGSRAKYKVTQSIPLVNGTINYTPADLKVVAIYKKDDGDINYQSINEIPTGNYTFNKEESYCTTDGTSNKDSKDKSIVMTYDNNSLGINKITKKGTKCFCYFDQRVNLTSAQRIEEMGLTATTGSTSFTGVSTSNEGLKSGEDDDGTTYYFRGNVTNNWVQFAGFYWRIIRINGDGTIRLIYNGTSTTTTGTGTQLQTSTYNPYSDNAYIGYMYGNTGSSTYATTHANTNNSTIKGIVDDWYKTNIIDNEYDSYISKEAGFCNDRKVVSLTGYTGDGTGNSLTAYGTMSRTYSTNSNAWYTTQTPSFKCSQKSSDLFTASSSSKGNHALIYPVGLITADEVIFGGGKGGTANSSYYLYTKQNYWTMSPLVFYSSYAVVVSVSSNGSLNDYNRSILNNSYGVRPVINLIADIKLTGTGTTSDPYKVV